MLVRSLPRTLAIMLAIVALAGLGTLARPVSAHATGQCSEAVNRWDRAGNVTQIPSIGYGGSIDCWMARGSNSDAVGVLQWALDVCYGAGLVVDSDFGPLTEQALRQAQSAAGTTPDGVYGPNTRDAINWPWHNYASGNDWCHRR